MRLKQLLLLTAVLALSACASTTSNTSGTQAPKPAPFVYIAMTPVSMACANHTDGYIHSFAVQEPISKQMISAMNCQAHEMGGGTVAAGYMLPNQWQPGMKVKVRWKPNGRNWIEKITTIRRYERVGTIYVHFFANDEIRVVSAGYYGPRNPGHPISMNLTVAPPEEE
jgi:hypothetical protein